MLGRDFEIRQVVDILTRRRQNNPILIGEAGVGKTAVVEGFAQRIVDGDVPDVLKNVTLRTLDLALLQAGAGVKGEFENRLKGLIEEVKNSPKPIILFIDEAHTMIGAGGQAGQGDAANLLKPALARGELRTIAATTWSEYKKYFEKDPALARRFQVVKVEEPTEQSCMVMMRGIVNALEKHHNVRILDEGVARGREAVAPLHRRPPAAGQGGERARHGLRPAGAGPELDSGAIGIGQAARSTICRCKNACSRAKPRSAPITPSGWQRSRKRTDETEQTLVELQARWEKERDLVNRRSASSAASSKAIVSAPAASAAAAGAAPAPAPASGAADVEGLRTELAQLNSELDQLQGETPLMRVCVDAQIVGEVISGWTGIPVGKMVKDEIESVLKLEKHLGARVIGQDHALDAITERIRTSKANLEDPNKPIGVFMLVGPSGVGKTETALALADLLYGGERNLITINMSEFQEAHTVSTLKGSPPGYVGLRRGRRADRSGAPQAVLGRAAGRSREGASRRAGAVLPGVRQGHDGRRRRPGDRFQEHDHHSDLECRHGSDDEADGRSGNDAESEGLVKALKPELNKVFKPAFLGRLVIIPYYPGARRGAEDDRPAEARQDRAPHSGESQDRTHVRADGDRDGRHALHGSGERRPQRRQHPDQHGAAGYFANAAGQDRGGRETILNPRDRRRRRLVRLRVKSARGRPCRSPPLLINLRLS